MSTSHAGSASSSDAPSFASRSRRPRKVNDSVFKFDRPHATPTMQILFFHGLQFEDSSESHFRNWESRDRSVIWPEEWLVEDFRAAEILYISYNGFVNEESHVNSAADMYIVGENLVSNLIHANVGQILNCPVILVGHCFGGIVIKQVCLQAHKLGTNPTKLKNLLDNIKGIFYYSTPHQGSDIFEKVADVEHPFWSYFRVLSSERARLNYEFDKLCDGWQIHGLGAGLPVQSGQFKGLVVVTEPSARFGDSFTVREVDHFGICKPDNKDSSGYRALRELLILIESNIPKAERLIHGLPTHPTGLEKRSHAVQVKLACAPVVGIVGMGGIGKSTIAKEVYNIMFRNFEYTCFIEDVRFIPNAKLERRILKKFYRRGARVDKNRIQWSDLERRKTLIVLDAVDHKQVIPLPSLDFFGEGSRLIITSRDQGVLDVFKKCDIYEVEFLMDDEAKTLFCRNAFEEDGVPDDLKRTNRLLDKHVEGVVRKCGGLPLTLEITGCFLKRHKTNAKVWKETIENLRKAQPVNGLRDDRVWASLKVSYDDLDKDLKGMFIESGTYFFRQPLEQALAAWSNAYGKSHTAWANLLSTSMVKEISKSKWTFGVSVQYKKIWVHEHLGDLANKLSHGWTVSTSIPRGLRIDLPNVVKSETRHLRILTEADGDDATEPTTLQLEILDKLEELKYLELQGVALEGSSTSFPNKLCLLIWKFQYGPQSVPISLQEMNNLAVLELVQCAIPEETIDALGTLINLRILTLNCISGLHRLPENLVHLSELDRLELSFIPDLESLPDSIGHLSALELLHLSGLNVMHLPESLGNLSSLETLRITLCDRLISLPESFGRLTSLTVLVISHCKVLQFLQLSELLGENCPPGELADSFGSLSSLTYLNLHYCRSLERLPPSFGMLEFLEDLELDHLELLDTLPENFGDLKVLNRLVITEAKLLKLLPESFGNLSALTRLRLEGCGSLLSLPPSFSMLSSLEELELSGVEQLDAVPETFGDLKALKSLVIKEAKRLKTLPDSFGNLSALTFLCLQHCDRLEILPASFGNLCSLEELAVISCEQLQSLPTTNVGDLRALKTLKLLECSNLESLPESLGNLSMLTRLYIRGARLQCLPQSIGQLHSLSTLMIVGRSLSCIPKELGNLSSLEILLLGSCDRIETLPDEVGCISSLRQVILHCCRALKKIPDRWGDDFPSREDTHTNARRTEQRSSVERIRLCVDWCEFLDDSAVLGRLGWIQTDREEFGLEDDDVHEHIGVGWIKGSWYRRNGSGERAEPLLQSSEP